MKSKVNTFCDWLLERYPGPLKDLLVEDYYENPKSFPLSIIDYFPSLLSDDLVYIWENLGSYKLDEMIEFRDNYFSSFTLREAELARSIHPPSDYICCEGCQSDNCRCCAGVCRHDW